MRYVFIPYSPRSWEGLSADAAREYPGAEMFALVLDGECPPPDIGVIRVTREGRPGAPVDATGAPIELSASGDRVVVANGGPTPLGVAAVLLAQRMRAALVNLQRDVVVELATDGELLEPTIGLWWGPEEGVWRVSEDMRHPQDDFVVSSTVIQAFAERDFRSAEATAEALARTSGRRLVRSPK